jgi:hypothetical protein
MEAAFALLAALVQAAPQAIALIKGGDPDEVSTGSAILAALGHAGTTVANYYLGTTTTEQLERDMAGVRAAIPAAMADLIAAYEAQSGGAPLPAA